MLRNVYLYGRLGEEFGEKWRLDVETFREACRAISINTQGRFWEVIRKLRIGFVRGEDLDSGEQIHDERLIDMNYGSGDFHIVPEGAGSGPAFFIVAALVAITAAAFIFGDKLFPFSTPNDKDGDDEATTSNLFGAVLNSGNQGQTIPLIYGQAYTGSIVISQGIRVIEVDKDEVNF